MQDPITSSIKPQLICLLSYIWFPPKKTNNANNKISDIRFDRSFGTDGTYGLSITGEVCVQCICALDMHQVLNMCSHCIMSGAQIHWIYTRHIQV